MAWPKLPDGVKAVIVVAVAARPVSRVALVGLKLLRRPTAMKLTRLKTLKTSNLSCAFTRGLILMFL